MVIPDLNDNQINEIIKFRKTFLALGENKNWISNSDPLQEIVTQMIFSKTYPEEEVNQWFNAQEEIIKKKIESL